MRQSRQNIEQELRRRICDGTYPPGSRLPLRRDLLRELKPSPLTLQRAMDRLAEQGFIHARGPQGTFVATHLPNRGTIALVFPVASQRAALANRFWATLLRVAEATHADDAFSFRPYFLPDQNLDSQEHQRLCADLADGGLAGLFFTSAPFFLAGSPLLKAACPRVCIASNQAAIVDQFGFSCLGMNTDSAYEAVFRRLRSAGRTRIGFLTDPRVDTCPWLPLLKELGLSTRPEWWLTIPASAAICARPVARLLCAWPEPQGVDALMITDDNLVPFATAGVQDAGPRKGAGLLIAAHANFPAPTHAAVPCLRFGTDVAELVRVAGEEIGYLAAGGAARVRMVNQVFRDGGVS